MPSSVASAFIGAGVVAAIAGFGVVGLVFACIAVALELLFFYAAGSTP